MVTIKLTTQTPCIYDYGKKCHWNAIMYITSHHNTAFLLGHILLAARSPCTIKVSNLVFYTQYSYIRVSTIKGHHKKCRGGGGGVIKYHKLSVHNITSLHLEYVVKFCTKKNCVKTKPCQLFVFFTWLGITSCQLANDVTGHHLEYIILFSKCT